MSHSAKHARVDMDAPSLGVERSPQLAAKNVASCTWVADIEIDNGVPSWSFTKYKTPYVDTLTTRLSSTVFSDEENSSMFDHRNVCRDMDIGTYNRRGTLLRRWCSGTSRDVFGFDVSIVRHAEEVGRLRRLLRLVRNVDDRFVYRVLSLCCFKDPIDVFYILKDADALWHDLEFQGRQRQNARGSRFIGWHSLEMFALPPSKGNDFYPPVTNS